jgi:hypothetical protein
LDGRAGASGVEEARDRVTMHLLRVARKRDQMTRQYRDHVTQLRKRWQVFRPRLRPARAVRFLVKNVKPATPTLQQKLTHTLGVGVVMVTCFMAGRAPQNLPLMYLIFCVCTIPVSLRNILVPHYLLPILCRRIASTTHTKVIFFFTTYKLRLVP